MVANLETSVSSRLVIGISPFFFTLYVVKRAGDRIAALVELLAIGMPAMSADCAVDHDPVG